MDHLVDFSQGDIIKIHANQIAEFKKIALENKSKKRYRLCLHDSPNNKLQEMFLCRAIDDYCRPDKHYDIPETHTIIEGREAIVLFDDRGKILDAFVLDRNSGCLSYRINGSIYHMTIPLTDVAVDYEVKLGPFSPETNIFPDWAPDGSDKDAIKTFVNDMKQQLKIFLKE